MSSGSSVVTPLAVDSRNGIFRFDEEFHRYYLGERILPGITGILKACGYIDPTFYTDEARNRGSHVHKAIHFLNKGTLDWDSVVDAYIGYVSAYEKFVRDWNLKLTMFERPLHHPDLLFGGTPDLVGTCLDNVPCIVELKTGKVMRWTALQTAAQELLVRAWDAPAVRRRRWGVTLNADGTYSKPKEFTEDRDDTVFRMLNSTVQILGAKTEPVLRVLNTLTAAERQAVGVSPLLNSVVEHRELYAA